MTSFASLPAAAVPRPALRMLAPIACLLALAVACGEAGAAWRQATAAAASRTGIARDHPAVTSQAVAPARAGAPGREAPLAGPAFEYAYDAPRSPELESIHARVRDADLLHRLPEVQAIDGMFELPRTLHYATRECGEFGAFYRPAGAEVVLCYETLRTLYQRGLEQQRAGGHDADYPLRYLLANVRFIVLHETGHALVDLLDLPATGRQEDAVDQLAAILMLRFAGLEETPAQVIDNLRMAANWMLADSTGAYDLRAYADEHALAEQRYFNLQCLIYGTDPARYAGMVASGDLTQARANVCPRETRRVVRAWVRLLVPHLSPRYATSEAEALRGFERWREHGPVDADD